MKYKITIDAIGETEKYSRNTLYEQTTDTIDLPAIVAIVNHIPYTAPAAQAGMTLNESLAHANSQGAKKAVIEHRRRMGL
jgi:hypothetical protein